MPPTDSEPPTSSKRGERKPRRAKTSSQDKEARATTRRAAASPDKEARATTRRAAASPDKEARAATRRAAASPDKEARATTRRAAAAQGRTGRADTSTTAAAAEDGSAKTRRTKAKAAVDAQVLEVRRIHRRDLNRVWDFLKLSFRDVNRATVEYQRPRSKKRFVQIYEEEGVEQLIFTVRGQIVAYAECTYEMPGGNDTWLNPRYFERRDMRPLYVEELAVHPDWTGNGVGTFVLEQLHHLARVRGLTHLVLEVAENNERALTWYRKRGFRKLDAAIFLAQPVELEAELLPPRALPPAAPAPDAS